MTEDSNPTFEERFAHFHDSLSAAFEYERIAVESVQNLRKELAGAEKNPMADHDVAFYCAKAFVYLKRWATLNKPDFLAEIEKSESGDAGARLTALEQLLKTAGLD